jgi:hypothetical protein
MFDFGSARGVAPGFDPHNLLTFTVDLPDGVSERKHAPFLTGLSKPSNICRVSDRLQWEVHFTITFPMA